MTIQFEGFARLAVWSAGCPLGTVRPKTHQRLVRWEAAAPLKIRRRLTPPVKGPDLRGASGFLAPRQATPARGSTSEPRNPRIFAAELFLRTEPELAPACARTRNSFGSEAARVAASFFLAANHGIVEQRREPSRCWTISPQAAATSGRPPDGPFFMCLCARPGHDGSDGTADPSASMAIMYLDALSGHTLPGVQHSTRSSQRRSGSGSGRPHRIR